MSQIIRLSLEQKHRFVLAALEPVTSMAQLCRTWHLSRQTGYKWLRRYQRGGLAALQEQSRIAHHRPHTLSALWGQRIENLRRRHLFWGPKKLRAVLRRQHPRARLPALSTIGASLRRLGLVTPRRRRLRGPVVRTRQARPAARPNDVWTADFKGWFTTTDGRRVDPLTVRDLASRFGLLAQMLAGPQFLPVQQAFVRLFRQHGQPLAIRTDNGGPFGSTGAAGLSRLSAWFISLGIEVQFSRRGHPEDNGAHEQWHRVLKAETARPPANTRSAQAARTTRWLRHYNQVRPHEALDQDVPAQHYRNSRRRYRGDQPRRYPPRLPKRRVANGGEIKWQGRMRFVGEAFAGRYVNLKPQRRGVWRVYYYHVLLGELYAADLSGLRTASHPHQGKGTRIV
jgi:transposase InsO family protein